MDGSRGREPRQEAEVGSQGRDLGVYGRELRQGARAGSRGRELMQGAIIGNYLTRTGSRYRERGGRVLRWVAREGG